VLGKMQEPELFLKGRHLKRAKLMLFLGLKPSVMSCMQLDSGSKLAGVITMDAVL